MLLVVAGLVLAAGCTGAGSQPDITKSPIKSVPVDDITIAYREAGSGEPLVMIMGYSSTMDLWDPRVLNELAKYNRVIIFDNRGMGNSTSSDREYSIRIFADDTAGLMAALGITKANVMGFSMGTNIAQELVLDYPDKVDKVILYAGDTGGKEAIPPSPEVLAVLADTSGTDRERGERLFKELFPAAWLKENPDPSKYFPVVTTMNPPENVQRQYEAVASWNGTYSRLPGITQPLLLVAGDQDVLTPPENSLIIAQKVPHSWMVRMRGGGHGVMYQYPDEFAGIVQTFLSNAR
ncbi:MAG: alpha/beta hydrolase [Methanoregulaceae archaeon]|nr:alpha/beta hydrolase [Methanoregulaceae archaeon]